MGRNPGTKVAAMSVISLFKKGARGKMLRVIPPYLIAISVFILAVAAMPLALWAQSEQEGIAIYKEARKLSDKAQSKQDREKALEKYQQALSVFRKEPCPTSGQGTLSWVLAAFIIASAAMKTP